MFILVTQDCHLSIIKKQPIFILLDNVNSMREERNSRHTTHLNMEASSDKYFSIRYTKKATNRLIIIESGITFFRY
jgi:hypothetical protein